eukprot:2970473-Prymnesium_polylepis.2
MGHCGRCGWCAAGCTESGSSDAQALAWFKYACAFIRAGVGYDGKCYSMFALQTRQQQGSIVRVRRMAGPSESSEQVRPSESEREGALSLRFAPSMSSRPGSCEAELLGRVLGTGEGAGSLVMGRSPTHTCPRRTTRRISRIHGESHACVAFAGSVMVSEQCRVARARISCSSR